MSYSMDITDWNKWMKARHIKLYTEEEWRKRELAQRGLRVRTVTKGNSIRSYYTKNKGESK